VINWIGQTRFPHPEHIVEAAVRALRDGKQVTLSTGILEHAGGCVRPKFAGRTGGISRRTPGDDHGRAAQG